MKQNKELMAYVLFLFFACATCLKATAQMEAVNPISIFKITGN